LEFKSCSFNSGYVIVALISAYVIVALNSAYVIVAPRNTTVVVVVMHGVEISKKYTNKFQRGSSFVVMFVTKKKKSK